MARPLSPSSPRAVLSLFLENLSQEEQGWLATVLSYSADHNSRLPEPFKLSDAAREEANVAFSSMLISAKPVDTQHSRLETFARKLNKICPSEPLKSLFDGGWSLDINKKTAAELAKVQEALPQPQQRRRASSVASLPVVAKTNFRPNDQLSFDCVIGFTFATPKVCDNVIQKDTWKAFLEKHRADAVIDVSGTLAFVTISGVSQKKMVEMSKEVSSLCETLNGKSRSRSPSPAR